MRAPLEAVPDDVREHMKYAQATERMVDDMWLFVFVPWLWPRWFRTYAEVKRRIAASREMRYKRAQALGIPTGDKGR